MELQLQRAELAAAEEADPALWAIGRAAAERLDQHDAIACGIEPWPSTRRRDDVRSVFA
jgi:hypothetical protein